MDAIDKSTLDCKTILPELDMFVKIDAEDKQAMQSVMPQHFTVIKSEKCNAPTISTSNIPVSRHEHDIENRELYDKMDMNEKTVDNHGRFENSASENIAKKQKQLNLVSHSSVDKYIFIKNKDSIAENTISLNTNITSSKTHNENMKTNKVCHISSNVKHIADASDDFSEEELSQYLLELEEEEKCKTKDTSHSDDTQSLLKLPDELEDNKTKIANQRHEDINDASTFEKITNQVSKISEEKFQEKKNLPIIYHSTNTNNENVIDIQCDDTLKIALNEKSKQLQNTQINELNKTTKKNDTTEIVDQDVDAQESILQVLSDIAIEEEATLKFENVEEQCNHNIDVTRNPQKNISTGIRSQDNNDNAVKNLSENKDYDERLYCQDITENNKDILVQHDSRTHDSDKISKTEIIYKIADADCTVSHANENSQEADGKLARPHTLDIVSSHNKNDSLGTLL